MKSYQEAATDLAHAEEISMAASGRLKDARRAVAARLGISPDGRMGLVPEPIRLSPEYRAAKSEYDVSFKRQREIAAFINRHYPREHRAAQEAWRDAKRAEQIAERPVA